MSAIQQTNPLSEFPSLTHIQGRMRPRRDGKYKQSYSQQSNSRRETALWLPRGFVEQPRFEIPLDVHRLSRLTPLQYLSQYCVVSSRVKKLFYHRQYTKYREPKVDGIDSLEKLRKAVRDVCTYSISTKSLIPSDHCVSYYLHGVLLLELNDIIRVNFKTFVGVVALAERIFNPGYMETWWKHDLILESDYKTYKKLREQEVLLTDKKEQREVEQSRQQALRDAEIALRLAKRRSRAHSSHKDFSPSKKESKILLAASSSERLLSTQVESNKIKLQKKLSITEVLALDKKPKKCSLDVLEQIDFYAVKWKFKDVKISRGMQRIIKIILSL